MRRVGEIDRDDSARIAVTLTAGIRLIGQLLPRPRIPGSTARRKGFASLAAYWELVRS